MSFGDFIDGYYDVQGQLPDYLMKKASVFFEAEETEKKNIKTVEQFEERKQRLRKHFIEAIGGLDFAKTPLNSVCCSITEREGYILKKVIFQSLPGVYVTANLYVNSTIEGKKPAVLVACGHSDNGKAHAAYQMICIDLVRNGFVVLAIDPVGQGERLQCYDTKASRAIAGYGVEEHSYIGLQCSLMGSNIARYFVWDLIRAVDYLETLNEVDSDRIGMTGNSGGGTQTAYMMLIEDRIKAAVPCMYITSREVYMKTGQSHDSEQNIYGAISEGLNYDDFISCFAPRPAMIGSVDSDFFCIEGAIKAYERAKKVYELYGYADNLKQHIAVGIHSRNDELRQKTVHWFIKHLWGENSSFTTTADIVTEKEEDLLCTKCGQVMAEFSDARSISDLNLGYLSLNIYQRSKDKSLVKKEVEELLNMPPVKEKIYPRTISKTCDEYTEYRNIFFFSQQDIAVTGVYITDTRRISDRCTILLLENGTCDIAGEKELIGRFLKQGDVFVFDPRGVGAVKSRLVNKRPYYNMYGTYYKLNCDAMMMKTSLMGLRVYDVLRACDFIRQISPEMTIKLAGRCIGAIYALLAAVMDDRIRDIYLENMIDSFAGIATAKYYKYDISLEIFGILRKTDIPELLNIFRDKNIEVRNIPNAGKCIKL